MGITSVEPVSCDAANATFKVVGRDEGKTQAEAQISLNTVAGDDHHVLEGEPGQRGSVLCLARAK